MLLPSERPDPEEREGAIEGCGDEGMNKTGIEWCDDTDNPVTGCLNRELGLCKIPCYASVISKRFARWQINPSYDRLLDLNLLQDDLTKQQKAFQPAFHIERLLDFEKVMNPRTIFVCSMADLFGEWVPWEWQKAVFDAVMGAPWHTYIFLTKNPMGMLEAFKKYYHFELHDPCDMDVFTAITWWGTTVNYNEDLYRIDDLLELGKHNNLFISFEPLLEDFDDLDLYGIKQVIIGAQTNPYKYPPESALNTVHQTARKEGCKIFYKDSIMQSGKILNAPRELCWSVHK